MPGGSSITEITARQVYSDRGHPGIEVTVTTQNRGVGVAICTAGLSIGEHEVAFVYDGGSKWRGKGVQRAVDNVNKVIAPRLIGMDATNQLEIDNCLLQPGGNGVAVQLGGNSTSAVSAAVLKAGAASLGIPLYQHIGGINACILPVPGVMAVIGSRRYGGGSKAAGKPSYSFMSFGFTSFQDASYAAWDVATEFTQLMSYQYGLEARQDFAVIVPPGVVNHDRQLWELMCEAIHNRGYAGKIGIQVDIAATSYSYPQSDKFTGLFSIGEKSKEDLIELYHEMVQDYSFVILEDPLEENDYAGHAELTKQLGIEIVGDDLFTTNPDRLLEGIEQGAANAVLLKVNQIGTISQALEMVQLAYLHSYGVMPCSSRGEGPDIADYAVGLNTGHLREGAIGATGNRLLKIETELGPRARFLGCKGLKVK
jgi:enolase